MFNEVEGLLKRAVSGEIDKTSLGAAAEQHVQSTDEQTVKQQMQQAADNASKNGNPDLAHEIMTMLEQHGRNPEALKQDLIQLIKENPDVLKHFEGGFAKDILIRIQS